MRPGFVAAEKVSGLSPPVATSRVVQVGIAAIACRPWRFLGPLAYSPETKEPS